VVDKIWTLFLDRDGVINEKLENDYIKSWDEFKFKDEVLQSIAGLAKIFGRVIIVTNQRGVGLGLMTEDALKEIHDKMLSAVTSVSGRIDKIYYCTAVENNAECRKPNIGMGLKAKTEFREIIFSKSIIVGDSFSDMEFGKNLGMKRIFIDSSNNFENYEFYDSKFKSLHDFYIELRENIKSD